MKHQVITRCGGIFWTGWSAPIGEYRWLWVAKCRAWWHVRIENPMREVTVVSLHNAEVRHATNEARIQQ
jgi:hypothetical protein